MLKTQTGYVSPKTVAGTSSVTQPQQLLYNDRLVIRDDTYYPVGALPSSQTVEIKDDHLYIDGVDTLYLAGRNVYIGEVINSVFLEKSISPLQLHKSKRNVKVKDELYKEDLGFGIEYSGGNAPTSPSGGRLGLYYSTLYASPLRTINLSNAYKYTDSQFLS